MCPAAVWHYTNVPAGPGTHYLVVDLSGGSSATNYPVSYLAKAPPGGWTEEHKTTKLVLRRIPATTPDFTMGSPRGELGRDKDETQHTVTLTEDFYIGVFEVTQRQWELVMGSRSNWFTNVKYYQTRPVEKVSYYAIRENPNNSAISPHWPQSSQVHEDSFMGKLRAKTGLSGFDLPTEAQWEYACRGGTALNSTWNSRFNLRGTGQDANMDEVGRYWYNGGTVFNHDCAPNSGTALVGTYRPNMWGLYDMHGNVKEWCLDWYGPIPETVTDPKGATSGSYRILRGGSFRHAASACRSASRDCSQPGNQYNDYGFRVYCKP